MKLPEPPLSPDLTGLDPVLHSAIGSGSEDLRSAIQRASRYANISKSTSEVSYSRRVLTLGIAELALENYGDMSFLAWLASWFRQVDPDLERVLARNERTDAVDRALKVNPRIGVSPKLAEVIRRASKIALDTSGHPLIDLPHLLFALTQDPGRAFFNFVRHPTANELAELRATIVERVMPERQGEHLDQWQALLAELPVNGTADFAREGSGAESKESKAVDLETEGSSPFGGDDGERLDRPNYEQDSNDPKNDESVVEPPPPPPEATEEAGTEFVEDDAELEEDRLERSVLAISLGRRLHAIWRRANDRSASAADSRAAHEGSRAAFVLHLDAPWGGGKTTFANFLARVLNPCPRGARATRFLRERYGEGADLGGVFLEDPPSTSEKAAEIKDAYPPESRRHWITVYFNAWQMEHIKPPWWAFYQAIRQSCFDAIRDEGDAPWDPLAKPDPPLLGEVKRWGRSARRFDRWLGLWADEFRWRFTNPKIYSLLLTALVSLALVGLLSWSGALGVVQGKEGSNVGLILSNPFGLVLTAVASVTGLWGLSALVTESIIPGTDTLAERMNLGSGDPFGRFRRHFARTMERVRRPIFVVVDDLDRCQPAFVVDLIRGIQTLLRSPRVVFAILGDREWIERAFESEHESMSKLDVGPEQTFGARFVEKAIQMSFILPALGDEARLSYVRHVVLGSRAGRGRPTRPQIDPEAAAKVRDFVNRTVARPEFSTFDTGPILRRVGEQLWEATLTSGEGRSVGQVLTDAGVGKDSPALEQIVNETLAINAATDAQTEAELRHELERFAPFFPANPRQIKRIINSITIYYSVAIQRRDVTTDAHFRSQLAIWIIVMTEWPQTWRLLASYPDLVRILTAADPMKALRDPKLILPGSVEATKAALQPILADRDLMALVTGKGFEPGHDALDRNEVDKLVELTPLHSRVRRLPEKEGESRRAAKR